MNRPGPSFNMGSHLPGQVNGGFTITEENEMPVTSLSGNGTATKNRAQAFGDPERIEKGHQPVFESFTEDYPADPSILSAMERTLAAFMNQGLLLVGIGTALMTYNQNGPNIVGWVLVPAGVLHIIWSCLWWTGSLVVLIVAASIVELSCNIIFGAFVRVTFPDGEGQGLATTENP
ncbi:PREDICTED: uncharacterized protein LOC109483566 [Branchiostoma belcheri]|uniref:Uncharacterized protein LOC109483566 n=1 Tax=Branchiostoma belcheri TaxID=7741 RepID=A0A6P5A7C5_BRABE|nr:PREDICTED: uncharacterized protein LOC109483566 [Branchiostoma belcheri]